MQSTVWYRAAMLVFVGLQLSVARGAGPAVVRQCTVQLIDEADVPAQEPGKLVALDAKEGLYVEEGTTIAQINDDLAKSEKVVAEKELDVARVQAESKVEIEVAYKGALVFREEYNGAVDANQRARGAKTQSELRALKYKYERAVAEWEKAKQDQTIAKTTVDARVAQVAQAQINVDRRKIVAPLSGEIAKVHKHLGEWAAAGEPVLRIVRLDRLRVEGFIDPKELSPSEIVHRGVNFETELAGGRKEKFSGKIDYVNFEIEPNKMVRVWAEVVNRREGDQWLLRPGAEGEMTIDAGGPVAATPRQPAANNGPKMSSVPGK